MIAARIALYASRRSAGSVSNYYTSQSNQGLSFQKIVLTACSNSSIRGLRTSSPSKAHPDNLAPEHVDNILPVSHPAVVLVLVILALAYFVLLRPFFFSLQLLLTNSLPRHPGRMCWNDRRNYFS